MKIIQNDNIWEHKGLNSYFKVRGRSQKYLIINNEFIFKFYLKYY